MDASLDLRSVAAATARRGMRVAFAADTHLHADFLTGARQLAYTQGARVLASADGKRATAHLGLRDGDEVDLGGLRLRALATPGHTHEHLSLLLLDGTKPLGVFTGGSLLVGWAARTDLISRTRASEWARAQHRSLQRLAGLPDDVEVWPTHGRGSFCSGPVQGPRTSTIGEQRSANPLLQLADEDEFVSALLAPLGTFPSYFTRLPEMNRRGPDLLRSNPDLTGLGVTQVRRLLADGAQLVDARPVESFAAGHVPGAVSIPLRPAFATWLGWVVPPDLPLVIVREPDQDATEIAWQAAKVGYLHLAGELTGGLPAWVASGQPTACTQLVGPDAVAGQILDIRQRNEYAAGHLPGALHVDLGELQSRFASIPREPITVMCAHGERAITAASLLDRRGFRDVSVMLGGPEDWSRVTGRPLSTGA